MLLDTLLVACSKFAAWDTFSNTGWIEPAWIYFSLKNFSLSRGSSCGVVYTLNGCDQVTLFSPFFASMVLTVSLVVYISEPPVNGSQFVITLTGLPFLVSLEWFDEKRSQWMSREYCILYIWVCSEKWLLNGWTARLCHRWGDASMKLFTERACTLSV